MKEITLQIDTDIAERIELSAKTLGIAPGELLSDFLLDFSDKPTRCIPGVHAQDIFNSLNDSIG